MNSLFCCETLYPGLSRSASDGERLNGAPAFFGVAIFFCVGDGAGAFLDATDFLGVALEMIPFLGVALGGTLMVGLLLGIVESQTVT